MYKGMYNRISFILTIIDNKKNQYIPVILYDVIV